MSLESILATARARKAVATALSTAEARRLPADIRARSLWSARTNHLGYVQTIADVVDRLLSGAINQATARAELQEELDLLGYDPQDGFRDVPDPNIPPAEAGGLRDLSSSRRINLMLDTQTELMYGRGQQQAGAQRIDTWPAWELIRVQRSAVPRDWPKRWQAAADSVDWQGVALQTTRMIARKDSPIWAALGDSAIFSDALDTDHPPFAFNSGMGWDEIPRRELADITFGDGADPAAPAAPAKPGKRPLNADLKASAKRLSPDLVEAVKKDLAAELQGSELRYQEALDKARAEYLKRSPAMARKMAEEAAKNRIARALVFLNAKEGVIMTNAPGKAGQRRRVPSPLPCQGGSR